MQLTNNPVLFFADGKIGIVTPRKNLILIDREGLMTNGKTARIRAADYCSRNQVVRFEAGDVEE